MRCCAVEWMDGWMDEMLVRSLELLLGIRATKLNWRYPFISNQQRQKDGKDEMETDYMEKRDWLRNIIYSRKLSECYIRQDEEQQSKRGERLNAFHIQVDETELGTDKELWIGKISSPIPVSTPLKLLVVVLQRSCLIRKEGRRRRGQRPRKSFSGEERLLLPVFGLKETTTTCQYEARNAIWIIN